MNDYGSPKRMKISKELNLCALNLSMGSDTRYEEASQTLPDNPSSHTDAESLSEMRNKFQQWVLETYRDASKTKTITSKKYDRIVKTLRGEIRNCAENSKFRFWMKCKGFKLESEGRDKTLYVLDKKGETAKYKKVAIVENFFDIIYNVHVNEGARGIQHAGQKRTHRSITETYAFLPREAVTKFLLCCYECQKRTSEDRKNSPTLVSSSSSHDSTTLQSSQLPDQTVTEPYTVPQHDENIPENYSISKTENFSTQVTNEAESKPYENNNNVIKNTENCTITPDTPTHKNNQANVDSVNIENLFTDHYTNDIYGIDRLRTRKRKRKFTRKIIRPSKITVEPCDLTYDFKNSSFDCPTSTPCGENCDIEEFTGQQIDCVDHKEDIQPSIKEIVKLLPEQFSTDSVKLSFASSISTFNVIKNTSECADENPTVDQKPNSTSTRSCPYFAKIAEILYNPVKYAVTKESKKFVSISNEEDLLEQLAVDLLLKAQELENLRGTLSENQRRQISEKIYNSRVTSFLLNYAADLMLKSLNHEI